MNSREHVIVVGMGPSGFGYLVTEAKAGRLEGKKITVLERGLSLVEGDLRPKTEVNYGMGGAGTFSDGKMVASTTVGGTLPYLEVEEYFELADRALHLMESFYPGTDGFEFEWAEPDMFIIPDGIGLNWNMTKVCHIGTERSRIIVTEIEKYLRTFSNIEWVYNAKVRKLKIVEDGLVEVDYVVTRDNQEIEVKRYAHKVINTAPNIIKAEKAREVHIGFRTESKQYHKYADIIASNYDFKISKEFEDSRARTFCACSNGAKVTPQLNGGKYHSWNGHGLADGTHDSVNFGILVTYQTTDTAEQLEARLAEINKEYPDSPYPISIVHTEEFKNNYPAGKQLSAFVTELDKLVGITDEVIYIPEVEVVQKGLKVKPNFEMVDYPGIYTIGTASGYARSIIQAIISGIIASEKGGE